MLATDPTKRPSAKEISESDCLKTLRETIERSGNAMIPVHPSALRKGKHSEVYPPSFCWDTLIEQAYYSWHISHGS